MTQEALKLALRALKACNRSDIKKVTEAITAIKEALAQPERDYERGFIDGMQKQMQSSVDKSVNAMSQRTWVHLTNQEHEEIAIECGCLSADWVFYGAAVERKVKEKNTICQAKLQRWVKLEGEEIRNLWEKATKPDRSTMTMITSFARAIESKLKEVNT